MANWLRGSLHIKAGKNETLKFIANLKATVIGYEIIGTNSCYIEENCFILNFKDEKKLEDGTYINKYDFASCGSLEIDELVNVANRLKVDMYIEVADPWGGYTYKILITEGKVKKNEVEEFIR